MIDIKDAASTAAILKEAKFGLWTIETEKDKQPRMNLNSTGFKVLGLDSKLFTPEQLFVFWYDHITEDFRELVKKTIKKIKDGHFTELEFSWIHPKKGEVNLWFGGIQETASKNRKIYRGLFRNSSEQRSLANGITLFGIAQALCKDFDSVYYVNIKTGKYKEFIGHGNFKEFKFQTEGSDFFAESIENIPTAVYIADRKRVIDFISKENLMPAMKARKTLSIRYVIDINGKPLFYRLTATPSSEEDSNHYIFGVQNIEENVKLEREYSEKIRLATEMANTDALTGIKNRLAYEKAEEHMNEEIKSGTISPFSIGIFDINNLKKTNDKYGHEAGDALICEAAKLICTTFTHSPVYRIGGDEFAIILLGADFFDREKIFSKFQKTVSHNRKENKVVVASGYEDFIFAADKCVADVFDRADDKMYENKKKLKKK